MGLNIYREDKFNETIEKENLIPQINTTNPQI